MFNKYIGWHIELTRRCPLACPACERTIHATSIPNLKLDIDKTSLFNFFKKENNSTIKYMFLQGNLGDPIYHPEFHEIAEYFFNTQLLALTTNGMHTDDFWTQVLESWPENSLIELSIDGLSDTNHIYRVNSNWERIQSLFDLIARIKRRCKIQWKYIAFEHNHHQINTALEISKKIGIDSFRIQKTRKLHNTDIKEYHSDEYFQKPVEYIDDLNPFCFTGDMHYITAEGNYYPCCWWADQNKENNLWNPVNIKDYSITQTETLFKDFALQRLQTFQNAPVVCKNFCKKTKLDTTTPNTQHYRKIIKNEP